MLYISPFHTTFYGKLSLTHLGSSFGIIKISKQVQTKPMKIKKTRMLKLQISEVCVALKMQWRNIWIVMSSNSLFILICCPPRGKTLLSIKFFTSEYWVSYKKMTVPNKILTLPWSMYMDTIITSFNHLITKLWRTHDLNRRPFTFLSWSLNYFVSAFRIIISWKGWCHYYKYIQDLILINPNGCTNHSMAL